MTESESNSSPTSWARWLQQGNRPVMVLIVLAIAAILAMVAWQQPSEPEMCDLFVAGSISNAELHQVLAALGTTELQDFSVEDGRILVPVEKHAAYLSAIDKQQAMPGLYAARKDLQPNPFVPRSQQTMLQKQRKRQQIGDMIRRLPFVAEAWIETDSATSSKMFQPDSHSAVVMVRPVARALTKQQVESIQGIVACGMAGISRDRIAVVDSNVGITWQDIRESNQAELIELVNWTLDRREFYLQQLREALAEFPGVKIEVEVRPSSDADAQPRDQTAGQSPFKLARRIPNADQRSASPTVGLNSAAEATEVDQTAAMDSHEGRVVHASYHSGSFGIEDRFVATEPQPEAGRFAATESVRVSIAVPYALLASESGGPAAGQQENDKPAAAFNTLKAQIIGKVKQVIPEKLLAANHPVSVSLVDVPQPVASSQLWNWQQSLEQYWPLAAILFIAVCFAIWSRAQPQAQPAVATIDRGASSEGSELQLQKQLSELIDSDPATAAKVLKKWIRQNP